MGQLEVCIKYLKGYDLTELDATRFQSCILYFLAVIY